MKNDRQLDDSGGSPAVLEEPPPEYDTYPEVRTLTPYMQRQLLFGRFLDDAETGDRQIAVAMATRARRIDELCRVSVSIAAEEAAEDASRPPELREGRQHESGWSIENRAKTELATEVAMAFNLSRNAARTLIAESETLVADLPLTLDALTVGSIRYEHARVIATTAWSMPREARAAFEAEVLPWAATLILAAFKSKVIAARERLHTEPMEERHEKAAGFRTVSLELGENGMGYLGLYDSNEVLAEIYNRVTDLALPKSKDDPRTLAQRRADVATEILVKGDLCAVSVEGGKPMGHGIVAQIHVEIPVLTLLGVENTPATLEGQVPIDPVTARRLVADAPGFYRLLTDPITGSIVAFDDRFRFLPASLRRAVELVDGTCTGPWCNATAHEAEGHHPERWKDSHNTSLENSALLCKVDHGIIHNTRWTMIKLPNGDKQWVSPSGRVGNVLPARRLSPAFVEALDPKRPPAFPEAPTLDGWDAPTDPNEELPF